MPTPDPSDLYRIGTVASTTGVAVERLRAWERRYGLEPAHKSGRTRFYSKNQVDRIALMKQLVDQGHPISSVVELDLQQLQLRLEQERDSASLALSHAPMVGLVGANLIMQEQRHTRSGNTAKVEVLARWSNTDIFLRSPEDADNLDVLLVQIPVLEPALIQKVTAVAGLRVVVLYQFGTSSAVSETTRQNPGVTVAKWPMNWPDLERLVASEWAGSQSAGTPRRFSDEELIAIAATHSDHSERIAHLIDLIGQLNAFAEYSSSVSAPQDSHEMTQLGDTVAWVRHQLETSLAGITEEGAEPTLSQEAGLQA